MVPRKNRLPLCATNLKFSPATAHVVAAAGLLNEDMTFRTTTGVSSRLSPIFCPYFQRFIPFTEFITRQAVMPGSLAGKTPNQATF